MRSIPVETIDCLPNLAERKQPRIYNATALMDFPVSAGATLWNVSWDGNILSEGMKYNGVWAQ